MKKEQQIDMNELCEIAQEKCYEEFFNRSDCDFYSEQLNHCNARIYFTENYIVLRSYRTIVACIDRCTGDFYDFLRLVYGYTATSLQHISKFKKLYYYCIVKEFTWRPVK